MCAEEVFLRGRAGRMSGAMVELYLHTILGAVPSPNNKPKQMAGKEYPKPSRGLCSNGRLYGPPREADAQNSL